MVICAAVRCGDRIYRGHRHGAAILAAVEAGEPTPIGQQAQGFLDHRGEFLTRRQAFLDAIRCGQLNECDDGEKVLISEDLY